MVTQEPGIKLTYEDYAKTPEDERWELINGELIAVPAPNTEHQSVQSNVDWHVQTFVRGSDSGVVFNAPTDVVLSDSDVVQPDLVFVSGDRRDIITHANIQGAPDLVVEILSPSSTSRDWREKFDLYALHGVKEYWLILPEGRSVWVFLLVDGVFVEIGKYGEGDTLTSPTLEGFSLSLDEVFRL